MMRTMVNGSHQWWTTQFKGTWKPKMVDNPEYKGKWEYTDDPEPDFKGGQ
jgi:hypothetical protein